MLRYFVFLNIVVNIEKIVLLLKDTQLYDYSIELSKQIDKNELIGILSNNPNFIKLTGGLSLIVIYVLKQTLKKQIKKIFNL